MADKTLNTLFSGYISHYCLSLVMGRCVAVSWLMHPSPNTRTTVSNRKVNLRTASKGNQNDEQQATNQGECMRPPTAAIFMTAMVSPFCKFFISFLCLTYLSWLQHLGQHPTGQMLASSCTGKSWAERRRCQWCSISYPCLGPQDIHFHFLNFFKFPLLSLLYAFLCYFSCVLVSLSKHV